MVIPVITHYSARPNRSNVKHKRGNYRQVPARRSQAARRVRWHAAFAKALLGGVLARLLPVRLAPPPWCCSAAHTPHSKTTRRFVTGVAKGSRAPKRKHPVRVSSGRNGAPAPAARRGPDSRTCRVRGARGVLSPGLKTRGDGRLRPGVGCHYRRGNQTAITGIRGNSALPQAGWR